MTIDTNISVWIRLFVFAFGAAYLWRSSFHPNAGEPRGCFDRGLRIIGAILLSIVTVYFVAYIFGFRWPN
jgi:hypothetical protein